MSRAAAIAALAQTQGRDGYPQHTYTFLAVDLRTDTVLAELPLSGVTYSVELNGVGALRGFVPVSAETIPLGVYAATEPARTAVWVDRDGVIMGCYIIWTREPADGGFNIGGSELLSYYGRRLITTTLSTDNTQVVNGAYVPSGQLMYADQRFLVWSLLRWAGLAAGGDIGVDINPLATDGATGITRSVTYPGWEYHQILSSISDLASADDGFDFGIEVGYSPGANGQPPHRYKRARVWYPQRGVDASISGLSFYSGGIGSSIISYDWPEDGTSFATARGATGAGTGPNTLTSYQVDTDLITAGFPLLEDAASYTSTTDQATLDGQANADLNASSVASTAPTFTVAADADPLLGTYWLGDSAVFSIDPDVRFPDGYSGELRIVSIEVTAATGPEVAQLSCVVV